MKPFGKVNIRQRSGLDVQKEHRLAGELTGLFDGQLRHHGIEPAVKIFAGGIRKQKSGIAQHRLTSGTGQRLIRTHRSCS